MTSINGSTNLRVVAQLKYKLNVERRLGNVFQAFNEGLGDNVPPFAPTYKYQPKTSIYEKRPDKKLRAPAWCDRILWHAKNEERVSQLSYDR